MYDYNEMLRTVSDCSSGNRPVGVAGDNLAGCFWEAVSLPNESTIRNAGSCIVTRNLYTQATSRL